MNSTVYANAFLKFSTKNTLDDFSSLTENSPEKIIFWVFSIVTSFLGPPLLYGIIWFERYGGSDTKRTLLNMFTVINCWVLIFYTFIVQIPEVIRFSFGPLPEFICLAQTFFKPYLSCIILLNTDAIITARYLFHKPVLNVPKS